MPLRRSALSRRLLFAPIISKNGERNLDPSLDTRAQNFPAIFIFKITEFKGRNARGSLFRVLR